MKIDFRTIKEYVQVPQAAAFYGMEITRSKMTNCPFHGDRTPSMKLNEKYYYCFGCQVSGDVIDLTAQLLGVNLRQAAIRLTDLEYKLLMVDDDMKMEALTQTHHLKTMVTLEDRIDIERKGVQSTQGVLYVRFAAFGNGGLHALYDRSNGFYRRQLLITTREPDPGRVDDPYLIEKLRNEKEGILLWALEGLHRLIDHQYRFTISARMEQNLLDAVEESNNLVQFMESSGYIKLEKGTCAKSIQLYKVYARWCYDNLEKPLSQKTFIQFLRQNEGVYGITYSKHVLGDQRGFHGIFVQVDPEKETQLHF